MKQNAKRFLAYMLTLALALSCVIGVQPIPANAASKKYVKSLSVSSKVSVEKGKKKTIKVTVKVAGKASKKVKVKSSNKKIVKVTYNAKKSKITLTGVKKGTAKVTVITVGKNKKGKKLSKKIKVTVGKKAVTTETTETTATTEAPAVIATQVTMSEAAISMYPGETHPLSVAVQPDNTTDKSVAWTSSNPNVASVDANGTVTGVGGGSAEITATNAASGLSAKCSVTVNIKATSLILSETAVSLYNGEKCDLIATVQPDNTTDKTITWTSSNPNVASVDGNGSVTAVDKGTAEITAMNAASGLSAKCTITVKKIVIVTSQAEMNDALTQNADQIEINAPAETEIKITKGSYLGSKLTVKGGKVTNEGSFESVTVAGAADYTEAGNNTVNVTAASTITINKNTTAAITVNVPESENAAKVQINDNGTVSELNISSAAEVRLMGESKSTTPVKINISSAGVKLVTNHEAAVNATAKADLTFTGTTENTTVTVDSAANTPDIAGSGYIEVTDSSTGNKTVVIAAPSEEMGVLDIVGTVDSAVDGSVLEGVTVELVAASNYNGSATASEHIKTVTTDASGNYKYTQVPGGNYYMTMKKSGYKDAIQLLAAASRFNTQYSNEKMHMLPSGVEDKGDAQISGTVKDASNKKAVAGVTVELRVNKGNIIGDAIQTAKTDALGKYSFTGLVAQQYTIRVLDNRAEESDKYISKYVNACVRAGQGVTQNINISRPVKGTGVRFVLSWGDEDSGAPSDLDSHLFGPALSGRENAIHEIYYSAKTYGVGNKIYSTLDVDETNYRGPETVTIVSPLEGIYYYYVYNYSGSPSLSSSSAQVDVYSGSDLLTTYNVPTNSDSTGDWWKVCSYNPSTQEIVSYNSIESEVSFDGNELGDDGDGLSKCDHGQIIGLYSVESTDAEVNIQSSVSHPSYDASTGEVINGRIVILSSDTWNTISSKVEYTVEDGYKAVFTASSGEDGTVGTLSITDAATGEEISVYDVFYQAPVTVYAPEAQCVRQNFDEDDRALYIRVATCPTESELASWTFTTSDPTVKAEISEYYEEYHRGGLELTYPNGTTSYVGFYIYEGNYLSSVQYDGVDKKFEEDSYYGLTLYLTESEQDSFDMSKLKVSTPEGYSAECVEEDNGDVGINRYVLIKNSSGEEVVRRTLRLDTED